MERVVHIHPATVLIGWQYGPINKHLAGKQFATDTDVKQAVTSWLQTLDNDLHCTRT
jgi:hypothetical protein